MCDFLEFKKKLNTVLLKSFFPSQRQDGIPFPRFLAKLLFKSEYYTLLLLYIIYYYHLTDATPDRLWKRGSSHLSKAFQQFWTTHHIYNIGINHCRISFVSGRTILQSLGWYYCFAYAQAHDLLISSLFHLNKIY